MDIRYRTVDHIVRGTNVLWNDINLHLPLSAQVLNAVSAESVA